MQEIIYGIKISEFVNGANAAKHKCVKLIKKWNDFAEERGLTKVSKLTSKRFTDMVNRFKEKNFIFKDILEAIDEQPYLFGDNRHHWKVNLDYLTRDPVNKRTYVKVLERGFK